MSPSSYEISPSPFNLEDSDKIKNNEQTQKNQSTFNLRGYSANKTENQTVNKIKENYDLQIGLTIGIIFGIIILIIVFFINFFKNKRKRRKVSVIINPEDLKVLERPKDLLLEYLPYRNKRIDSSVINSKGN